MDVDATTVKGEGDAKGEEELDDDIREESKGDTTGKTFPCTFAGCNKILGRQSRLKSHL